MILLSLVLAAVVPPDEVIVYPDRARVSRTQTVPCPATGPVLFEGLPPATDERSIAAGMQYVSGKTNVVWPTELRTAEPVLPLPPGHAYAP